MHPPIDWLNICILLGIFSGNIVIGFVIRHRAKTVESDKDLLWAHVFWATCWLIWLVAWLGLYEQWDPRILDFLNDFGAVCLIGFAVAFASGRAGLRDYWLQLALLVVLVGVYLAIVSLALNWVAPTNSTSDTVASPNDIVNRTILFAPSLCLVIFGFGLVASAFVRRVEVWESSFMALLVVVYALLHVPLAQVFSFVPGLRLPHWWRVVFLSWRVGLIVLYWLIILMVAGLKIRAKRFWEGLVVAGSILASVAELLRK